MYPYNPYNKIIKITFDITTLKIKSSVTSFFIFKKNNFSFHEIPSIIIYNNIF